MPTSLRKTDGDRAQLQPQNVPELRSLPQRPSLFVVSAEGQVQVHTSPYRGSFSIVLSEAIRAAGLGSNVLIAQLLKGGVNQGPANGIRLCGGLEWLRPDINCCLHESLDETTIAPEDANPQNSVQAIWDVCKSRLLAGNLDQLVLDELGLAISLGYLSEDDVISALEKRPHDLDVIITGPSIPEKVLAMANQVTELRCGI